jgi:hypothetical protein
VSGEKRNWSFLGAEEFAVYVRDANRFIQMGREAGVSPFAASLAGVAMIRSAIANMGGDPQWWVNLIMSTEPDPLEQYTFRLPDPVT